MTNTRRALRIGPVTIFALFVVTLALLTRAHHEGSADHGAPPGYRVHTSVPLAERTRLELLEDERISPTLRAGFQRGLPDDPCHDSIAGTWPAFCATIHTSPLRPARLRIVSRADVVTDTIALERPIAELQLLDSTTMGRRVYSLTVDLSADAGSYSGPYARLLDERATRIAWLRATDAQTDASEEIHLPSTLKTGWRAVDRADGRGHDILLVACRPDLTAPRDSAAFQITYTRFLFADSTWTKTSRTAPGCWESDDPFPGRALFP